MVGFIEKVGFITVVLTVLYIIKKFDDYLFSKKLNSLGESSTYIADEKVYKAARAFAQGISLEDVREILSECIDFDEEDVEQILAFSWNHTSDEDGGYSAFIKAVNKTLGKEVYHIDK